MQGKTFVFGEIVVNGSNLNKILILPGRNPLGDFVIAFDCFYTNGDIEHLEYPCKNVDFPFDYVDPMIPEVKRILNKISNKIMVTIVKDRDSVIDMYEIGKLYCDELKKAAEDIAKLQQEAILKLQEAQSKSQETTILDRAERIKIQL